MESENYIQAYLNSKSNSLSFYVLQLLEANVKESNWLLIEKIVRIIDGVERIIQKMGVASIPVNNFCNQLVLIKDKNIPKVDAFLKKYNYFITLNQKYNSIKSKISEDVTPTKTENRIMEFLISNHLIDYENQTMIYEYYIKNILLKEQLISYDSFETLMIDYAKMQMQKFIPDPIVEIKFTKDLENKYGYSYQNIMYLCKEELEQMYFLGLYRPLKTIFHELCHISQYRDIHINSEVSKRSSILIKDEILSSLINNYYEDNYERILSEVEAEIFSIQDLLTMFAKFGIVFKNNQNPYQKTIAILKQNINNDMRIVGGKEILLDEVFDDTIINHPKFLNIYPQLALEYHLEFGDLVVKNDFRKEIK